MGRLFQMKYIEELSAGDTFEVESQHYIVTCDFKSSGHRSCINLKTGQPKWIDPTVIVDHCPIYTLDKDNNIIPLKITEKVNV